MRASKLTDILPDLGASERPGGSPKTTQRAELEALVAEKTRRLGQRSLGFYTQHTFPGYDFAEHLQELAAALEAVSRGEIDRLIVTIPVRHGKLCADSTPVLTARGWVTHGDLSPGDEVVHPSGALTRVVAVSAPGLASVEVEVVNGDTIKVHPDHEWVVRDRRRAHRPRQVMETREIAAALGDRDGQSTNRLLLPAVHAAEFPRRRLPMHPYVLGAWLGDGTTGKPCLTHAPADAAIVARCEGLGYRVSSRHVHRDTGCVTVSFAGSMKGRPKNRAHKFTRHLDACGVRFEKRIPGVFKVASIAQRLDLLAGMVDTDGHTDRKSGRVRVVSVSRALLEDAADVAVSLGWRTSISSQEPAVSSSGIEGKQRVYTLSMYPDRQLPVVLPRKRLGHIPKKKRRREVKAVRPCPPEVGRCVQVEAPDGLYCVGRKMTPTHNSVLASKRFPLWHLGNNPADEIIHCSYGKQLVSDFGTVMRNQLVNPSHRDIFPDLNLLQDAKAANRWITTQGGVYVAAGVTGAITGRGMDCIAEGTMIEVQGGSLPVEDVRPGMLVSTHDGESGRTVWRRVLACQARSAGRLVEVESVSGFRVRATPDHRFLVPGVGWREARSLRPGDQLQVSQGTDSVRAVREVRGHFARRTAEEPGARADGDLLLPVVPGGESAEEVRYLWIAGSETVAQVLLRRLQALAEAVAGRIVPQLREALSPPYFHCSALFTGLRERHALTADAGGGELPLQTRRAFLPAVESADPRAGRSPLRELLQVQRGSAWWRPSCRAPHRRGQGEQRAGKSGDALLLMSQGAPQRSEDRRIERPGGGEYRVHDLQVEGTHCFFAGGLLVHNCGIIDDPVRGREDAESERIREKIWNWYTDDFYTRLLPGGRIVVVGSRWHESDLIGRLLNDSTDDWHVVHQKALSDDGEALWPSRYPVEALERIRRAVGPRAWNSEYQGEPTPDSGTYFDRESIHIGAPPPVEEMSIYAASDYATGESSRGDYTVHMIFGVDQWDRLWVLDVYRDREAKSDEWAMVLILLMRQWQPILWGEEKGQILKSVGPFIARMQRELSVWGRRKGYTSAHDKPTRAVAVQGYIALHGLHLPAGASWVPALIHEMMTFPYGSNDDQVDCLSLVGRMLAELRPGEAAKPQEPKRDDLIERSLKDRLHRARYEERL